MSAQLDRLWERYGQLDLAQVPADAQLAACQCMLDWLGVTLAGSAEPLAAILRDEFAGQDGPATVIGTAARLPVTTAALVNGATGHALDFDDTNMFGGHHATAAVLPALLAAAEEAGASGADVLTAYVAGVEVSCRLRVVIGEKHYRDGWHITSTLGVYGAVAAAGLLMGLDTGQFGRAAGLASSQAGGVHANFGTMAKPFHAGFAAERGLLSARLAARGFTASPDAFERAFTQMSGDVDWGRIAGRDDEWAVTDTYIKEFVSGHGTQATILAARELAQEGLSARDVVHAEVRTAPSVLASAYGVRVPADGLQSKFCLPGVLAFVLLGHDLSVPASYSDANVSSPEFLDLIGRIDLVGDSRFAGGSGLEGEIVVQTAGATLRRALPQMPHSSQPPPHTWPGAQVQSRTDPVNRKFAALAGPVVGGEAAARLRDVVLDLASLKDVRELCDLTRPS